MPAAFSRAWHLKFPIAATVVSISFSVCATDLRLGSLVITALVASSGDLGLSAFLPASDRVWAPWNDSSRADPSIAVAPHLPLAADYRAANFTLGHVFSQSRGQTSSVRNWTTELIARYRFTIGEHLVYRRCRSTHPYIHRHNAIPFCYA